jgi:hypothetical protein
VPAQDVFARHDHDGLRADGVARLSVVVGGDAGVRGDINIGGLIGHKHFALEKVRKLPAPEILAGHLLRLEIELDRFPHPKLAQPLDAHAALGLHLAGDLVDGGPLRGENRVAILHHHAVGGDGHARVKVECRAFLGFNGPAGLQHRAVKECSRAQKKQDEDGGAQFSH